MILVDDFVDVGFRDGIDHIGDFLGTVAAQGDFQQFGLLQKLRLKILLEPVDRVGLLLDHRNLGDPLCLQGRIDHESTLDQIQLRLL